jgi:hypothetical protein
MYFCEVKFATGRTELSINHSKKVQAEQVRKANSSFMRDMNVTAVTHGEWNPETLDHQLKLKKAGTVTHNFI